MTHPAAEIIRPAARVPMWDWNVQNVDFSLDNDYRAASHGRYDPDLMPWWKFIVDHIDNPATKEIVVLGISQGGKEEHCLCFPARYWSGTNRRLHCLYVGHQEEKAEEIYMDRVIGGMKLTHPTRNLLGSAKQRGMIYNIGVTRFGCTHGGTGGGLKGKPWDAVFCSEISSYKSVAILDEARKRGLTRPFFKLVMWGCPDWRQKRPSQEDPLFVEHDTSTQHEWMMPDPVTGNLFSFTVGNGEGAGLYWDLSAKRDDGSYDLELVERSAYFKTPDGTVIPAADRWKVIMSGDWVQTNPKAPSWKVGVHFHQLLMPWEEVGGFGHIARRFVESMAKGMESYRTFRYEVEAAKWYGQKITIEASSIDSRKGGYKRGQRLLSVPAYAYLAARKSSVIMSIDVQKDGQWFMVRDWFDGGDSAAIEWGYAETWKELAEIRAKYGVWKCFVDLGYKDRRNEVLEQCLFGEMKGMIPMLGRDTLREPYKVDNRDPFEGTAKAGRRKLPHITFNPDQIKHLLARLIKGEDTHTWMLPENFDAILARHLNSEESEDGAFKKKHNDNHLWDCEVMQLLAAMVLGVFRQAGVNLDVPDESAQPATPAPQQPASVAPSPPKGRRTGVYYSD